MEERCIQVGRDVGDMWFLQRCQIHPVAAPTVEVGGVLYATRFYGNKSKGGGTVLLWVVRREVLRGAPAWAVINTQTDCYIKWRYTLYDVLLNEKVSGICADRRIIHPVFKMNMAEEEDLEVKSILQKGRKGVDSWQKASRLLRARGEGDETKHISSFVMSRNGVEKLECEQMVKRKVKGVG